MAVWGFQRGVGVSDRPGLSGADLLTHVYYAAGLFVLGGLDLGTPVSGPQAARSLVWVAYFLAPMITTSAVIEGALRLVGTGALDRLPLRRHVVIVGFGRLATTFVSALRAGDRRATIVALERDSNAATLREARRDWGLKTFWGDARSEGAFAGLQLQRARCIAMLTGDDLLNLEVAHRLAVAYPQLPVVAHVSDVALQRAALEVERPGGRVQIFNAHLLVGRFLYERYLHPYFQSTEPEDTLVLVGFGAFCQSVLELLSQRAEGLVGRVLVMDPEADASMRAFRDQVTLPSSFAIETLDADPSGGDTWRTAAAALGALQAPPVILVATADEGLNLRSALQARKAWRRAPVLVRCQNQSAFTEALAQARGFTALAVGPMLQAALFQAQTDWLGEARPSLGRHTSASAPPVDEGRGLRAPGPSEGKARLPHHPGSAS